jgi:hypothetical protein
MIRDLFNRSSVAILGLVIVASLHTAATTSAAPRQGTGDAGAPCIAMLLPTVSGVPGPAQDVANGVRDMFATFLTAPAFKTIRLDARLPALAATEAREKQCPNILTVTLTGKQSGGSSFGKLAGQAAAGAAIYTPGGSSTGSSVVRGAVRETGWEVRSLSSQTKAKDALKIEYKIQTTDNAIRVGPGVQEARAKVNGEDLLTPIVQGAATEIANALMKAQ